MTKLKINIILILMLTLVSKVFAFSSSEMDSYLESVVKSYHVPGMAFFITNSNETLFEKTYGQCTSLNQKFFIGSESKSFTALCIMQLVEEGLINLDDDITKYLPELSFSKPVTVKMLLNQNSGFDTHAKLKNVRVTDSYGRYEYANVNYDLLGKIVESVSGMSYKDYIYKNVFMPLSMNDSVADAGSVRGDKNLLKGNRNFFGFFVPGEADYPTENSWFHESAGYICSSPSDFQKYLRMYLNGGKNENGTEIISALGLNRMWSDSIFQGNDSGEKYGMGWNIGNFGGQTVYFHGGQVENYITFMFIIPSKNLAVSFMINGNDQFGMNNLMNDAVLGIVNIINRKNPAPAKASSYLLIHLAIDFVYLFILILSLMVFIKSFGKKRNGKIPVKVLVILFHALWIFALIFAIPLAFKTPLWVIRSYVPDLFTVIVLSLALTVSGAAFRFTGWIKQHLK